MIKELDIYNYGPSLHASQVTKICLVRFPRWKLIVGLFASLIDAGIKMAGNDSFRVGIW